MNVEVARWAWVVKGFQVFAGLCSWFAAQGIGKRISGRHDGVGFNRKKWLLYGLKNQTTISKLP